MKRKWLLPLLALAVVLGLWPRFGPEIQARIFVAFYADPLEESMSSGNGIPAGIPVKHVNSWEGEHPMTEFLLSGRGLVSSSTYFGCYYSPDDVPLAFQNAPLALTEAGNGCWTWQGDGDNRGMTRRLRPCWYYYEASF